MDKDIFIVRHGETDFNKEGIIQGRGVDSSLNKLGYWQARRLYEFYQNAGIQKIYTSTLKRTHQTVELFIQKGIPWEQHPGLDEIDWGIHEGRKSHPKMKAEYEKVMEQWSKNNLSVCTPGGESPLTLQSRQLVFLDHLKKEPYSKVLVCTHGRAMRALLCTMCEKDLCKMENFPHSNTAVYMVRYEKGKFNIEIFNNLVHLEKI